MLVFILGLVQNKRLEISHFYAPENKLLSEKSPSLAKKRHVAVTKNCGWFKHCRTERLRRMLQQKQVHVCHMFHNFCSITQYCSFRFLELFNPKTNLNMKKKIASLARRTKNAATKVSA